MNETKFRGLCANFVIIFVLALAFSVSVVATIDQSTEQVNNAIYGGKTDGNEVALMFNVYENTQNALKIAETLDEYGFCATFFVGGTWVARNGDALLKLASSGFEIGNHGYMHRDHATLTLEQNLDEIRVCQRLIDATLSTLPNYKNCMLFAPPSGSLGNAMFQACEQSGYKVIMWTRDTIDWRDHDVSLIYERAIKNVKSGDLILMHPTDCTVEALPKILDYLKSRNLKADKVSNVITNL